MSVKEAKEIGMERGDCNARMVKTSYGFRCEINETMSKAFPLLTWGSSCIGWRRNENKENLLSR
jgi:hypothetical protein